MSNNIIGYFLLDGDVLRIVSEQTETFLLEMGLKVKKSSCNIVSPHEKQVALGWLAGQQEQEYEELREAYSSDLPIYEMPYS